MGIGRNDPCPCRSGKKYKHCCSQTASAPAPTTPAANTQIADLLRLAMSHFQAGQLPPAEQCCRRILALNPNHVEAAHILGTIALKIGQPQPAAELLAHAIKCAVRPSEFLYLKQGMALRLLGRHTEAVANLQQALRLQPRMPDVHFELGMAWQVQGQVDETIASYQQAVAAQPDHTAAWNNLGQALVNRGRIDEAIECYRQTLRVEPDSVQALSNMGAALTIQKKFEEAATFLHQAVVLQPTVNALNNLGTTLLALDRLEEAVERYRQALALDPLHPMTHTCLGTVLQRQGLVDQALLHHRQALTLQPGNASAHSNYLLGLQYRYGCTAEEMLSAHREYAAQFEAPLKPHWPMHANDCNPERRLRIGYVSADFYDHAVAYFIEPVLTHHDRGQVEIFCYYNKVQEDAVTARIRHLADHWIPCRGMDDDELAQRIQADRIDILVDLAGHTALNRLLVFARRPAPVQVTWLGYPGTTGLDSIDYRMSDAILDPVGESEHGYCETVVRLTVWAPFQPVPDSPPVNPLPALSTGHLTLACLNNLAKLNDAVIRLWARILTTLPTALLVIGYAGEPGVRAYFERRFAEHGIGADRLRLLPKMNIQEYLALHHEIDLNLDSFPYTGVTSTNHSLWMGVPVVTLAGDTTVSRQGATIMQSLGLPELIAHSEDEYLDIVVQLANDLPRLDAVRQSLRERMAPSTTARELTRSIEAAYRSMWRTWCASELAAAAKPARDAEVCKVSDTH